MIVRESGILMPIFSLPSKYGIGCFSKEAYQFVDQLKKAGQKKWQILPLGPTSFGDSPYQSFSTFAGNPYFIDLETLICEGLLTEAECSACDFGNRPDQIDYEKLGKARFKILKMAYKRFTKTAGYEKFIKKSAWWLDDYSLFMALKDKHDSSSWDTWETPYRNRDPEALNKARKKLSDLIGFYCFQQYKFARQWNRLHKYAAKKGIEIIGDLPIYVAFDSADAWANPQMFQFNKKNEPIAVAGCPPDAFSPTGQLWGNPLYKWEYHKETGYDWWFKRIAHTFTLFDVVRIDHFRGFDEYYSIPAGNKDAVIGEWMPGPSMDFFDAVKEKFGTLKIIAEDLGFLTDTVMKMLEDSGFPGMKVIQFAFDSRESANYLPHTYIRNCVVYTGTHDNDTTRGWYQSANDKTRNFAREYLRRPKLKADQRVSWEFIAMAMSSVADLCVIPIQDYLCLGSSARINTPSTLGNNWVWRMKKNQISKNTLKEIRRMTKLYGRL